MLTGISAFQTWILPEIVRPDGETLAAGEDEEAALPPVVARGTTDEEEEEEEEGRGGGQLSEGKEERAECEGTKVEDEDGEEASYRG